MILIKTINTKNILKDINKIQALPRRLCRLGRPTRAMPGWARESINKSLHSLAISSHKFNITIPINKTYVKNPVYKMDLLLTFYHQLLIKHNHLYILYPISILYKWAERPP